MRYVILEDVADWLRCRHSRPLPKGLPASEVLWQLADQLEDGTWQAELKQFEAECKAQDPSGFDLGE